MYWIAPVSGSETGRKRRKIENADSVYYPDYSMVGCVIAFLIGRFHKHDDDDD